MPASLWPSTVKPREARGILHRLSAFASRAHGGLAQESVGDTPNEMTAIPALLDLLDLAGGVVTIDAMG